MRSYSSVASTQHPTWAVRVYADIFFRGLIQVSGNGNGFDLEKNGKRCGMGSEKDKSNFLYFYSCPRVCPERAIQSVYSSKVRYLQYRNKLDTVGVQSVP